ncbi:MAG: amino acid adenylation domain-containing protein [Tissierellaceae bacterium]|nr:amino acid adenylation domain-containing protein [Tissierellaceae bacterium]
MQKNVLEYLEKTVISKPHKTAYVDKETSLTFEELYLKSKSIGSALSKRHYKEPIVVFMGKSPKTITAFYGVLYSGNYYVPIDEEMPYHRIELIFKSLSPKAVVCHEEQISTLNDFSYQGDIYLYENIIKTEIDQQRLDNIRERQIDTDPMYIVFTSGSTGMPKGVVASHRSVMDYVDNLSEILAFDENTVFGNQTPLYVDASLKELYPTIKFGSTTYLIPKELFMFPLQLVGYLNEHKINTICWVVSALTMISSFGTLDKERPKYLHTIAFGSEVFPIKQFNLWRKALTDAKFVNLYGPTEATGMSCYYEVNRSFELDEAIPIGRPFNNTDVMLLNENDQLAKDGEEGEICIRGTSLTLGYYNDFERTREAFVQNPLNSHYPELIYRTGDIGKYNEYGELVFVSRKDNQIKHMGHRIELGEIEMAANMAPDVNYAVCVFDDQRKRIILIYTGEATTAEIADFLKDKLPRFMIPNRIRKIDDMPFTSNGKINRNLLKEEYTRR